MRLSIIILAVLSVCAFPPSGAERPPAAPAPAAVRVGPGGDEGFREPSGETVQAALDRLRAGGGTLILARGDYKVSRTIAIVGSRRKLVIHGEPGARLVFGPAAGSAAGAPGPVISIRDSGEVSILGIEVRGCAGAGGLEIRGSSRILIAGAVLEGPGAVGIEIDGAGGSSISGSRIEGFSVGVRVVRGSENVFTANTVRARRHAFLLEREASGNALAGNLIEGGSGDQVLDRGSGDRVVEEDPIFSFGAIADVQYADKETLGGRRYREALGKLRRAVEALDRPGLIFIADLGDIIDGNGERSLSELDQVLAAYGRSRHRRLHVIGNHCLAAAGRETLLGRYGLARGYRASARDGFRFLFLDGMDLSLEAPRESETYRKAREFLDRNPWAGAYSGGLGEDQMRWLRSSLEGASRRKERVLVFCHLPILEGQSSKDLLLWNHEEVSGSILDSGCVAACFSGHDHAGGYAVRRGVHFVTLPGLVEAPEGTSAFAQVQVHDDFLIVSGSGTVPSRCLEIPPVR